LRNGEVKIPFVKPEDWVVDIPDTEVLTHTLEFEI